LTISSRAGAYFLPIWSTKLPSCFQLQLISDKYNNSCYVSGRHNSGISPYNWPIGTAHGKLIREIAGRKNWFEKISGPNQRAGWRHQFPYQHHIADIWWLRLGNSQRCNLSIPITFSLVIYFSSGQ
jgi:hypothetical protein